MKKKYTLFFIFIVLVFIYCGVMESFSKILESNYKANESLTAFDRNDNIIFLKPNHKGYYAPYLEKIPLGIKESLLKKEDKWFYLHFGFNPLSILEQSLSEVGLSNRSGSSTLTQQLAKILLNQENQRTLKNKIKELFYALALEFKFSKDEILLMYLNSVYLGNNLQGFEAASQGYFNQTADSLPKEYILKLLAALSNPVEFNPLNLIDQASVQEIKQNLANYKAPEPELLELSEYLKTENKKVDFTLDKPLNDKIREITYRNIEILKIQKAKNAAVVVLVLPQNEIIGLIGSPHPLLKESGYQINMVQEPRPTGSTMKPFIYIRAFEKGMRPYTLINDREHKYYTKEGFSFYPKNYDNKYRGLVSAHYALVNSINVPALKTLEFVGVAGFADFLIHNLGLIPVQDIENYQLGIAMGTFEANILDLARVFTIFPNHGWLYSLKILQNQMLNEVIFPDLKKQVSQEEFVQLINKILNDRKTSQDQFSYQSVLNLPAANYALKTGTSQDYRDSWVFGYTPDFLVAVWVGNADNSKTEGLSGQQGAGIIWSEVMQVLLESQYNKKTDFDFSLIKEFKENNNVEFGLMNDNFQYAKNILSQGQNELILNPHNEDGFLLESSTKIIFKASREVAWKINGKPVAVSQEFIFSPSEKGRYQISAQTNEKEESIFIRFF